MQGQESLQNQWRTGLPHLFLRQAHDSIMTCINGSQPLSQPERVQETASEEEILASFTSNRKFAREY
jgi:hypothetical protein